MCNREPGSSMMSQKSRTSFITTLLRGAGFNSRTGKYDNATSKWAVMGKRRPDQGVSRGKHDWTFYLVVGSLAQVEAEMEAMADARWKTLND